MKIKSTMMAVLLTGLFFASSLDASAPVYRRGCEFPLPGVEVCWEATAQANDGHAPYTELHMLPISRVIGGQEQVLVDTTRQIYRQLLPGALAERLIPEWKPVYHLEQAMMSGMEWGWPAYMWIAPRAMRNSSEMSPGLVDWDVYFFADNKLTRTLRIRVESKPKQDDDSTEIRTAASAFLMATTSVNPFVSTAAAYGAGTMSNADAPQAGRSLELLTELATRQITFLAQFPINDLNSPADPLQPREISLDEQVKDWKQKIFGPK